MSTAARELGCALVIVDVQNDFCEGGSLPVAGGAEVARRIASYLTSSADLYQGVVATRDWHIEPGRHFASAMGKDAPPDFVESWPDHCVVGTPGADYHPNIAEAVGLHVEAEFLKGRYEAAYSGFQGRMSAGSLLDTALGDREPRHGVSAEPDAFEAATLEEWLHARGIGSVDVVGIATDYCVMATAKDAVNAGFEVNVLTDLVAGVAEESSRSALEELARTGVGLVTSSSRWKRSSTDA